MNEADWPECSTADCDNKVCLWLDEFGPPLGVCAPCGLAIVGAAAMIEAWNATHPGDPWGYLEVTGAGLGQGAQRARRDDRRAEGRRADRVTGLALMVLLLIYLRFRTEDNNMGLRLTFALVTLAVLAVLALSLLVYAITR